MQCQRKTEKMCKYARSVKPQRAPQSEAQWKTAVKREAPTTLTFFSIDFHSATFFSLGNII